MIFHIAVSIEWHAAVSGGVYAPPSIATEGLIHSLGRRMRAASHRHTIASDGYGSTREQIIATANLFYRGRRDLTLLTIDESRLSAPLRYETPAIATDSRAA